MLLVLRDEGPQSQQTLGTRLNMDRTTTMQLVDALERLGVVVRQADPADRRAHRVALTAVGRRRVREIEREVLAVEARVLSGLSAAERRTLNRLLRAALEGRTVPDPQP
jgi:DNA-binding MarR family transcriptional regulator